MRGFARFLEPPRLRTVESERQERATRLELFFDLAFVVAVTRLAQSLREDPTAEGPALPPIAVVWLLAGALATQVVVELAEHERHVVPDMPAVRGS